MGVRKIRLDNRGAGTVVCSRKRLLSGRHVVWTRQITVGTIGMKTTGNFVVMAALGLTIAGAWSLKAQPTGRNAAPSRPKGPCDIYAAAGDPCAAAHSTTRALYAAYNGPLYQVLRHSDGKTLDIGVVQPTGSPAPDAGGYANAAAQDAFCAGTYCFISKIYDQSPRHNDLIQAPRGGFAGPAMGGFNNLPIADMAPISIMGHKVYGVFIEPGMGLRQNDARGTAVDDQAEGQYWVINGRHFNSGCCFDYGNAEIDSRDDGNGTMETTYFGDTTPWYHGNPPGPWVMTDQENNLVGCVNPDGSKLCANLPNIEWRFVTAMAKGEPHHWTSMGGDSQRGTLQVMYDGPRIDPTYDPMRKQGAILLGNGGDNSVGSQGTFYEGAMTAANTFPTDATDQMIQANVVEARYAVQLVSLAPASAVDMPPGVQTFSPGTSQEVVATFTNTTSAPATDVKLSVTVPGKQWTTVVSGSAETEKLIVGPVAPGSSVSATFKVTSGAAAFNGDLIGNATWTSAGGKRSEKIAEKVRNVSPIKINEFRVSGTNSFIELYNAGSKDVDVSNWSLTEHQTQQAIFSSVKIPAGSKLAAGGFYLLGLSNSALSVPAKAHDSVIAVRSTTGMTVGDSVTIDTGSKLEPRKIAAIGTPAGAITTLWQPVPEGPVITIPVGSTNVPVTSVAGFAVGEKIALGHGATYPAVARDMEQYEVATVTAVGKPGTQAFLGTDAPAGSTNIKVTSVANISVGDKIRLDIDSLGHGIETVTVAKVGTPSIRTGLTAKVASGATSVNVRSVNGIAVGDKILIGTPANLSAVTVTAVTTPTPQANPLALAPASIAFTPAIASAHASGEDVVDPGTGLDLAAPLKFMHTANLPFGDRGTGITFTPATAFAHSSNEPIQPLGTGITLDSPLTMAHATDAVVHDAAVTTAGYQGPPTPNQWFGGPALSPSAGAMVLRDAAGLVVDSLNYGLPVDPWAAKGYQAKSGGGEGGCRVPPPTASLVFGPPTATAPPMINASAGRFPDGTDTDSNCTDFVTQSASTLSLASAAGGTNIKVASVIGFRPGQTIMIDSGAQLETAVISSVGTAGATTVATATSEGATVIPVASAFGFIPGQAFTIGSGASAESAVVVAPPRRGVAAVMVSAPLKFAHPVGTPVAGTGITLATGLTHAHAIGAQISDNVPKPGAANKFSPRPR